MGIMATTRLVAGQDNDRIMIECRHLPACALCASGTTASASGLPTPTVFLLDMTQHRQSGTKEAHICIYQLEIDGTNFMIMKGGVRRLFVTLVYYSLSGEFRFVTRWNVT